MLAWLLGSLTAKGRLLWAWPPLSQQWNVSHGPGTKCGSPSLPWTVKAHSRDPLGCIPAPSSAEPADPPNMGWARVPYGEEGRRQEYPRFGAQVLETGLEIRDKLSGVDCDLSAGLGDVFRPGFSGSVCPYSPCDLRRWPLGLSVHSCWRRLEGFMGSKATAPPCS